MPTVNSVVGVAENAVGARVEVKKEKYVGGHGKSVVERKRSRGERRWRWHWKTSRPTS